MFTPRELALERGWPGRIEGDRVIQLAAQTLQSYFTGGGEAREHAEYELDDVDLRPPVLRPPSVRDFMAFEEHVANARRLRGAEVPKEWYEIPVFYFSNPHAIFGDGEVVPYPLGTSELDYELECAAIIGAEGKIGGFTVTCSGQRCASASGPPRARTSPPRSGRSSSRRTSSTGAKAQWSRA
jgi:hypothetical protein